jgi:hypothetical protein
VGQLIYDDAGRVSAQLVRADQKRFESDDWREAQPDEMIAARSSFATTDSTATS